MAIILITHNFGIIGGIADRVAVMFRGKIVEEGQTRTVLSTAASLHQGAHPVHPETRPKAERLATIDHAALEAAAG